MLGSLSYMILKLRFWHIKANILSYIRDILSLLDKSKVTSEHVLIIGQCTLM